MSDLHAAPPGWPKRFFGLLPSLILLAAATAIVFAEGEGCGDSPAEFRGMGIAIAVALGLVLILASALPAPKVDHLRRTSDWLVRHFLIFIMMSYGWAKILDMQFSTSLLNLDTRLLELSPMSVAWSFFGYTYTYQAFAGLGEVLGALFLCFRRTRTLGASVLLAVMSNVVLVNFYYDVCVKLNSSVFLAMVIYFLLMDGRRLWTFFFTERPVPGLSPDPWQPSPRFRPWLRAVELLALAFVLVYPIYDVQTSRVKYGISDPGPLFGAWRLESVTVDGEPSTPEEIWQQPWDRFFMEIGQWGSARGGETTSYFSYELGEDNGSTTLTFRDPELVLSGKFDLDAESDEWRWELDEAPKIVLRFSRMREFIRERK